MWYCFYRFRDKNIIGRNYCYLDLAVRDRVLDPIGPDMFTSENVSINFDHFETNRSFQMMNWWIKITQKRYLYPILKFISISHILIGIIDIISF